MDVLIKTSLAQNILGLPETHLMNVKCGHSYHSFSIWIYAQRTYIINKQIAINKFYLFSGRYAKFREKTNKHWKQLFSDLYGTDS